MTAAIPIRWSARAVPLTPTAVVACGPVAARLADRLLTFADDLLLRLRGVAGRDLIVLTGESSDLPWLDGVDYLGRDPLAPGLYIPTTLEPTPSVVLLERALRRRAPQLAAPLALIPAAAPEHFAASARPAARDDAREHGEPREPYGHHHGEPDRHAPLAGPAHERAPLPDRPFAALASLPAPAPDRPFDALASSRALSTLRLVSLADARPLARARIRAWRGHA